MNDGSPFPNAVPPPREAEGASFRREGIPPANPLLLASLLLFVLLHPAALGSQEPPPRGIKVHGVDVAKLCREVEARYRNKKDRNVDRLVEIFNTFDEIYPKATDRERKMMVRTLRKGFDIQPFPKESRFLVTAAACFADMGDAGRAAILYALKRKTLLRRSGRERDAVDLGKQRVEETLILALGFNGDPEAVKPLLAFLKTREAYRVNAACRALSRFSSLSLAQRKPLVEKIIQAYLEITREAEAKGEESPAYDLLLTVEVQFNEVLNRLTLRSFDTADEWKSWFDANKGKKKW